jgi:D-alanyl-D-alanine carboxypeptidase/D-alanyl-D-alanine-endopeptidase (penicillin-binding protein 4)|tara:strand:+ start:2737 stop:4230 length:1494 start_codon:yes stop_codon:yes gene_type:complete
MFNDYSRRAFLSSALSFVGTTAVLADAPLNSLYPRLRGADAPKVVVKSADAIVTASKLSGKIAFVVADAKSGARLEGMNAKTSVAPASVTKAITALYALNMLGAGHRFTTRLIATGGVSGGVVQGDLILAGGGDPTLDTDALADMARQLKASGIREVRGRFLVYDGALPYVKTIDTDQPDQVGYSPAISGIALNYNRVHFEWRRASGKYSVAMDARSAKYRPNVTMAKMRIVEKGSPVFSFADKGGVDNWTVARGALANGGSRWLPVRKPALYVADVFATMADSQGIRLKAAKVVSKLPTGTSLLSHNSEPLRKILREMLKYSTNLTAEMVGMAATIKRRGRVSGLKASANEMNGWAKSALGVQGMKLVDHSGLGAANRMTADAMVGALVKVYGSDVLRPILKDIPVRDEKRKVIENSPFKVVAKTGTLNFVSGLGGYMTAADGTVLAFAIFVSDEKIRSRISKANREAPQGAKTYNTRAKKVQQKLLGRWGSVYGS